MKSENIGNIVSAIAKCSVAIGAVSKDGYNKAQGYAFVGDEHIMQKAQRALAEHGLCIAPVEMKSVSVPSIKGTQNVCTVSVTWLVSHESGEWLTIQTIGEGADSADKGAYKAMTGARKYAFRLLFNIPTGDDAERDETPAQAPVQRATTTAPANPVDAEKEERRGILRNVLGTGLNITQENQLLFRDTPIEQLRRFQTEFRGQLENLEVAPGVAFSAAAKYLTGVPK
jgi:hypothetical protein